MSKRTQLIYGNCQVLSPDGELMFRCLKKRANWYLNRDLATIIEEDPLTIKLNFEPKGMGERHDLLLIPRENKCVVCGIEDLSKLTRHHLVPYEYRKYFPEEKKSNNSAYIIPICRECHDEYEEYAIKYKKIIGGRYNAPLNGSGGNTQAKAASSLNTIIKHGDKLPEDRMLKMRSNILDFLALPDYDFQDIDIADDESLNGLYEFLKAQKESEEFRHGKMVVNKLEDIDEFSQNWVQHFFETMDPQFASDQLKDFFQIDRLDMN